ncbi:MAG: type IV secretion system DNA-binding domain-containing protein [Sedimentisphaerales bacterium]|nr:type IV secretion system DNA-binding domain-containing protein [Sedimentisphaerales bacterium]
MNKRNNDKNPITTFAVTNFRDIRKRFGIKQKNRRGHMYIIGKTGTGKSTLIENMVISDIKAGNGLALIDPHGDLAEDVLNYVPRKRINDVIYFNPADTEYPIAFNPLAKVSPEYHHLVTSGLISVFKKVWSEFWGPRLEHILRHSILTLLEYPGSTILDIPRLLTDKDFRQQVLKHVSHQQVREFWFFEFDKYSSWLRSEAISPILNKVGQFLTSAPLRNIVGQKKNTFRFRKVLDEGKIFITNLAKGKIGEDNCSLLGAMLVTQIQLAALSRADLPESKRRAFYLYVDEVHNFLTLSFADILSEARKYGLNLILSHQYIEQLDEKIRAAIFGNVGTIIAFRVGAEDAKYLAREFHSVFSESDLVNLPNYHIYLKLMIDGAASRPFSAVTFGPSEKNKLYKSTIIELSRKTYARPRQEAETEILSRNRSEASRTKQSLLFPNQ